MLAVPLSQVLGTPFLPSTGAIPTSSNNYVEETKAEPIYSPALISESTNLVTYYPTPLDKFLPNQTLIQQITKSLNQLLYHTTKRYNDIYRGIVSYRDIILNPELKAISDSLVTLYGTNTFINTEPGAWYDLLNGLSNELQDERKYINHIQRWKKIFEDLVLWDKRIVRIEGINPQYKIKDITFITDSRYSISTLLSYRFHRLYGKFRFIVSVEELPIYAEGLWDLHLQLEYELIQEMRTLYSEELSISPRIIYLIIGLNQYLDFLIHLAPNIVPESTKDSTLEFLNENQLNTVLSSFMFLHVDIKNHDSGVNSRSEILYEALNRTAYKLVCLSSGFGIDRNTDLTTFIWNPSILNRVLEGKEILLSSIPSTITVGDNPIALILSNQTNNNINHIQKLTLFKTNSTPPAATADNSSILDKIATFIRKAKEAGKDVVYSILDPLYNMIDLLTRITAILLSTGGATVGIIMLMNPSSIIPMLKQASNAICASLGLFLTLVNLLIQALTTLCEALIALILIGKITVKKIRSLLEKTNIKVEQLATDAIIHLDNTPQLTHQERVTWITWIKSILVSFHELYQRLHLFPLDLFTSSKDLKFFIHLYPLLLNV